jgi:hypothetical protein
VALKILIEEWSMHQEWSMRPATGKALMNWLNFSQNGTGRGAHHVHAAMKWCAKLLDHQP